jgi:hypothetical protein
MTPEDLQRWKENEFTQFIFNWINQERINLTAKLQYGAMNNKDDGLLKIIGGRIQQLNIIQTISPEDLGLEEEKKDEK